MRIECLIMDGGEWGQAAGLEKVVISASVNVCVCGMFLAVPYLQLFRHWNTDVWDGKNRYPLYALLVVPTFMVLPHHQPSPPTLPRMHRKHAQLCALGQLSPPCAPCPLPSPRQATHRAHAAAVASSALPRACCRNRLILPRYA